MSKNTPSPTSFDPASCKTLTEVLRLRSERTPDKIAYTYLTDGETTEENLTYGEL